MKAYTEAEAGEVSPCASHLSFRECDENARAAGPSASPHAQWGGPAGGSDEKVVASVRPPAAQFIANECAA